MRGQGAADEGGKRQMKAESGGETSGEQVTDCPIENTVLFQYQLHRLPQFQ